MHFQIRPNAKITKGGRRRRPSSLSYSRFPSLREARRHRAASPIFASSTADTPLSSKSWPAL